LTIVPVLLVLSVLIPFLIPTDSSPDADERTSRAEAVDPGSLTLAASPSVGFVGQEITFFANASSDNPAASLTFTIYYDYYDYPFPTVNTESGYTVNVTGTPGQVVTKWTYDAVGNYSDGLGRPFFWVMVFVTDGANTVQTSIYEFINYNSQPYFISTQSDPLTGASGALLYDSVIVADWDSDVVTIHWDYGDGTWSENVTVAPPEGIQVNTSHVWNHVPEPGRGGYDVNYSYNVTIWDEFNPPAEYDSIARISVPPNVGPTLGIRASAQTLDPNDEVTLYINATDYEGDPLTWMVNWSDGTVEVFHTPASAPNQLVWNNRSHVFGAVGVFPVRVNLSDALPPYQVGSHNVSTDLQITTVSNSMPSGTLNSDPAYPEVNTTIGYLDVRFILYTSDVDGDVVTVTWDMGDGGPPRTNASLGGIDNEFIQILRVTDEGFINVTVVISDGRPGHVVTVNKTVKIQSTNRPPDMVGPTIILDTGDSYGRPNRSIGFTLVVNDPEGDVVSIIWNWGDNSSLVYLNVSEYDANGNATITLNHTYTRQGTFTIVINWTDNKIGILDHVGNITSVITVFVPAVNPPDTWSWWDYTSLGLFLMIPIVILVRMIIVGRRRRAYEARGTSLEEMKLRKEELTFRKEDRH